MANDVGHIFLRAYLPSVYPLVKCLSMLFVIGLVFFLLSFQCSLYILDTSLLLDMWLANVFSLPVPCLHFHSPNRVFHRAKAFHFYEV